VLKHHLRWRPDLNRRSLRQVERIMVSAPTQLPQVTTVVVSSAVLAIPGGRAALWEPVVEVSLDPDSECDVDGVLVRRAQSGDQGAFETLVRRHADRLYRLVARLVDDPYDAEEVTQEAFVRAWRSLDRFRGDSQFYTWLYRIGVNEARRCCERRERRRRRVARSLDLEPLDPPDLSYAPHQQAAADELRRALEDAIRGLPSDLRTPLVLRDVEGLSTMQAAAVVGVGEAAFKSRLHRARLAVRKVVEGYLTGDEDAAGS
jgi:RNA polymerase sigma-70 factor (ECF subfamily)